VILRSLSKAELEGNVFVLLIVVGMERLASVVFIEMTAAAKEVVRLAGDAGVVLEDVAKLAASGSVFRPGYTGRGAGEEETHITDGESVSFARSADVVVVLV